MRVTYLLFLKYILFNNTVIIYIFTTFQDHISFFRLLHKLTQTINEYDDLFTVINNLC